MQTTHYFDLATILSFLVGTLLPIVVGRVTTVTTHPALKGAVLLFLSAATGVLSQWLDAVKSDTPFAWQAVVLSAGLAFVMGVATHTGFWQHTPLSSTGTPFGTAAVKTIAIQGTLGTAANPADISSLPPDGMSAGGDVLVGAGDTAHFPAEGSTTMQSTDTGDPLAAPATPAWADSKITGTPPATS